MWRARANARPAWLRPQAPQPPKDGATLILAPAEFFVERNLRPAGRFRTECCFRWGDLPIFHAETTAFLRAVLDEVCESVSRYESSARTTRVHDPRSRQQGETSVDRLEQIGGSVLARPRECGIMCSEAEQRGQSRPGL
jgi:hypothetical protein